MDTLRPAAAGSLGAAASDRRRAEVAREPAAFEAAVRPLYPSLVRRLVMLLGNEHDAEDVAQDAYLAAFRAWARFDGTDVRAWLYTIALRLAFNQLRRRKRWLDRVWCVEPEAWTAEPTLTCGRRLQR